MALLSLDAELAQVALDRVTVEVRDGDCYGLIGHNGSGKTSLLRAMVGMLDFEAGEIRWNGEPVRDARHEFFGALVWLGHRVGLKADLTLTENLHFESCLRASKFDRFDTVIDRLGLERLRELPMRSLSAGQQRRVALARMLLAEGAGCGRLASSKG